MAVYFPKNLSFLIDRIGKNEERHVTLENIAIASGIPRLKLERWLREGEPVLGELRKLADFFSNRLGREITADDLINRDLSTDPFIQDVYK